MSTLTKALSLCVTSHKVITLGVFGYMPIFSLSACFAQIAGKDGTLYWRYDAIFGIDPSKPMHEFNDQVDIAAAYPGLELELTICIPVNASTLDSFLRIKVINPPFQRSPIVDGMNTLCRRQPVPSIATLEGFDIYNGGDRLRAAKIVRDLYTDYNLATEGLKLLAGPNAIIFGSAATGPISTGVIATVQGKTGIILKVGTQLPIQVLYQGAQLMDGPRLWRYGIETIPFWREVGGAIVNYAYRIGVPDLDRVIIVGHSLGGASAICAGLYLGDELPTKRIDVLTFGSPRAANREAVGDLEANVRISRIENFLDPVPYLPPRRRELFQLAINIVGDKCIERMERFANPVGGNIYMEDGTILIGDANEPDVAALTDHLLDWVAGQPGEAFQHHDMDNYVRSIEASLRK